jgi:C_GCAxxG_C_C family probable redox protein
VKNYSSDAHQCFLNGYSCSQAIFAVYGRQNKLPESLAVKIACGFAGGMLSGHICGAVSGVIMVLGLMYAGEDPNDRPRKEYVYDVVAEYISRFKMKFKTVECRELLEAYKADQIRNGIKASEQNTFTDFCPTIVKYAADLLDDMIRERTNLQ